jgi:hypothetical protein
MSDRAPRQDMTDNRLTAESIEPALANEPIDETLNADPIDAILKTEPIEPMLSTEPSDAMDKIELRDRQLHLLDISALCRMPTEGKTCHEFESVPRSAHLS